MYVAPYTRPVRTVQWEVLGDYSPTSTLLKASPPAPLQRARGVEWVMKNEKWVNDNHNHNVNCRPDGKLRLWLELRLNEENSNTSKLGRKIEEWD